MITITERAAKRIKELMADKDSDGNFFNQKTVGLRVFVQGGGCSGFQYGLQIEHEPQENDSKFESNGIRVFVDPISISYLKGAVIDFGDGLMGGGFSINNPNVRSTCGCGQSFEM